MNFQQLRSVREAVRCGFNLTEVAHTLHTSQPGVSRQIRELEDELGIQLFVRAGKRLTGLTEPGGHVLPIIERMLQDSSNLRQAGQEFVHCRATAHAFYRLLARSTDIEIPVDSGDFRLMSRRALNVFLAMPEQSRFIRGYHFEGGAASEMRFDFAALPAAMDIEARLSRLTQWVIEAEARNLPYAFRLGRLSLPSALGGAHREACLRALALHGLDP